MEILNLVPDSLRKFIGKPKNLILILFCILISQTIGGLFYIKSLQKRIESIYELKAIYSEHVAYLKEKEDDLKENLQHLTLKDKEYKYNSSKFSNKPAEIDSLVKYAKKLYESSKKYESVYKVSLPSTINPRIVLQQYIKLGYIILLLPLIFSIPLLIYLFLSINREL